MTCKISTRRGFTQRSYLTGFTLIELLVVVLIIGILTAVAVPQYQKAVTKTRYKNMLPILRSVVEAQQVYYLANGTYATSFSQLDVDLPPATGACTMNRSTTAVDSKKLGEFCVFLTSDNSVVVSTIKTGQGGRNGYQWTPNTKSFAPKVHWFCINNSVNFKGIKHCTGNVAYPDHDWVTWYYMD